MTRTDARSVDTYAPTFRVRHLARVSLRNVRARASEGTTCGTNAAPNGRAGANGLTTFYPLRAHRANGAVYAPTPYGEVCVDDEAADGSDASARYVSERARGGRALNPDFAETRRDRWVSSAMSREGREREIRAVMGSTRLELVVYATSEGEESASGDGGSGGARWRRGEGRSGWVGGKRSGSDGAVCRAAIDLSRLVRVGDGVPSGAAVPENAVFLHMSDGGVYVPEPSAADGGAYGGRIRAFLDALESSGRLRGNDRRWARGSSFGGSDSGVADDDWDARSRSSPKVSSSARTPTSTAALPRPSANAAKLDVRTMVAKIESLIEADRALGDAEELREELARRLSEKMGAFDDAKQIWKKRRASRQDGSTDDERIAALTQELANERDRLRLMKEDVGRRIRALRQAGERLVEANERLDEAERALRGPDCVGKLYQKQRALVARRWRLVGELAEIFPIERVRATDNREHPLLRIGDDPLDLGPAPSKTTQEDRVEDLERDAAAYGNVAQICIQLAAILDVRLRYPVCPCLSRSYICDFHQVQPKTRGKGQGAESPSGKTLAKIEFPLFMASPSDQTRYTYGVFLLNKNLEQLLNAHGLSSVGPRHTLQNLSRLFEARKQQLPATSTSLGLEETKN